LPHALYIERQWHELLNIYGVKLKEMTLLHVKIQFVPGSLSLFQVCPSVLVVAW